MSGATIIGALLREDKPVTAAVPAEQIKGGKLPDNVPLPALLVRVVSVVDRQPLKRGAMVRVTARVSVTVRAASYADQGAIIKLIRSACAGKIGAIGGAVGVAILTAGTGPDVLGPANSFEQTQDFSVSFNEPA